MLALQDLQILNKTVKQATQNIVTLPPLLLNGLGIVYGRVEVYEIASKDLPKLIWSIKRIRSK